MSRIRVDRDTWSVTIWYDPTVTSPAQLQVALDKASEEVDSLH